MRDLCDELRSAYRDMEMGIDRLQDMVEEGGAEKRCADLEEQVRGLKAALARVKRFLVRLGGGVVRPAPAPPPIRPRPQWARPLASVGDGEGGRPETTSPAVDGTAWSRVVRKKRKTGRVAGVGNPLASTPGPT